MLHYDADSKTASLQGDTVSERRAEHSWHACQLFVRHPLAPSDRTNAWNAINFHPAHEQWFHGVEALTASAEAPEHLLILPAQLIKTIARHDQEKVEAERNPILVRRCCCCNKGELITVIFFNLFLYKLLLPPALSSLFLPLVWFWHIFSFFLP